MTTPADTTEKELRRDVGLSVAELFRAVRSRLSSAERALVASVLGDHSPGIDHLARYGYREPVQRHADGDPDVERLHRWLPDRPGR